MKSCSFMCVDFPKRSGTNAWIIKERFLYWKKIFITWCRTIFFGLFFGYLIRFSFIYGNLAYLNASEASENILIVDIATTLFPALLLLILFFQGSISSIYSDFSCKWHLYTFAAPLNPQALAIAKFGELLCLWLVALFLEFGTGYLYGHIFGFVHTKTGMIAYCFLAVCILLIGFCMLPMSYRYRTQNSVLTRLLIGFFLPVYLVFGVFVLNFSETTSIMFHILKLWCISHKLYLCGIAFLLIFVVGFINYLLCIHILRRRDCVCGD